jgi:acetyl esterase/lipase
MVTNVRYCFLTALLLVAPSRGAEQAALPAATNSSLLEVRQGFNTKLLEKISLHDPAPNPPTNLFRLIKYPAPVGDLAAYVSPPPEGSRKHPAIIWIFGGFSNSTGETAWEPGPPENDQSARAFREAGIITMYPSFRGGNDNPGFMESFYGEVSDVIAAADYLKKLEYVDPKRIYLGGHSTGGTLALLVAESTNCFRSVFSFGPVSDVRSYGKKQLFFDIADFREAGLRAPVRWLHLVHTPTYVFEGSDPRSNIDELKSLARVNKNSSIHFHAVSGGNHFSIIRPVTRLIAKKILEDTDPSPKIAFSEKDLSDAMNAK